MREEKSTVSCHVSHRATKRSLKQHSLGFAGLFSPHCLLCFMSTSSQVGYMRVSHCQYIESRSSALKSVPIQAQTVAPGQNASPCSAPSSAAPLPPTLPTLPLASFSCSHYTANKYVS